ncbi:MAG: acyltransferase [Chitinophagaceae bacterium]
MTKINVESDVAGSVESLKTASNPRLAWVDYARALAITLVVYRHTMVGLNRSGLHVPSFLYNIQEFLYNVRMPVFVILSGMFLGRSLLRKSTRQQITSKVSSLLYPYFVWTLIFITIQIFLSTYTNSKRTWHDYLYIITDPRELDHMWYLVALFTTSCILIIVAPVLLKRPVLHLAIAFVLYLMHYFLVDYSILFYFCYYYIFLCIGVHASSWILPLDKKSNKWLAGLLITVLPFFIAGQLFWLHNIGPNYEPDNNWYIIPFFFIILVACVTFYAVCRLLYNAGILRSISVLGKASLYIYILHLLFISSFRIICLNIFHIENVYVIILGSLVAGITGPYLIYRLSLKWRGIHYLFSLEKKQTANG